MTAKTIHIRDLTKRYGPLEVLDNLNLSIRQGEFVSVVGPSGCGKSTLLKIIGGLVSPSSGTVMLDGEAPRARRKQGYLGFVFQNPVLLAWRTVEENMRLPWEILGGHIGSPEKIQRIIETVGLTGFNRAYPHELSGGMQQRAALARSLIYEPSLLLMDEPFAAVDELTRGKLNYELLRIWHQLHTTIVFVTHSVEEAVLLSDRIIVLTQRPARIVAEVEVILPRPRIPDTMNTEAFHQSLKCVRSALNSRSGK